MGLYLGEINIGKLYLGETKIGKMFLGDNLIYSSSQPTPGETLYLSNNGTVLHIGTGYNLPTTIHNIDTGTTTTTVTRLANTLSIGTLNVASGSSSSRYIYTPVLETDNTYTGTFVGGDTSTDLVGVMMNHENDFGSVTYTGNYFNQGYSTSGGGTYSFGSDSGGLQCKLSFKASFSNSTLPYISNSKWTFEILDSNLNPLTSVSKDNLQFAGPANSSQTRNVTTTPVFTVPEDGNIRIRWTLDRTGDSGSIEWQHVYPYSAGIDIWSHVSYYSQNLYCNISRTKYVSEEHPEYNEDFVEVAVNTTNTNATKMISISDQGIATLSDITNN